MSPIVTRDEIETLIFETLRTMAATTAGFSGSARLKDLDIDSLDIVELTQVVEDEAGVDVSKVERKHLATVDDVVQALVAATAAPA